MDDVATMLDELAATHLALSDEADDLGRLLGRLADRLGYEFCGQCSHFYKDPGGPRNHEPTCPACVAVNLADIAAGRIIPCD